MIWFYRVAKCFYCHHASLILCIPPSPWRTIHNKSVHTPVAPPRLRSAFSNAIGIRKYNEIMTYTQSHATASQFHVRLYLTHLHEMSVKSAYPFKERYILCCSSRHSSIIGSIIDKNQNVLIIINLNCFASIQSKQNNKLNWYWCNLKCLSALSFRFII